MTAAVDVLNVFVEGHDGRWEVVIEVNGKELRRFGPWADQDVADMYAAEALDRANKIAERFWETVENAGVRTRT